MKRRKPDRRPPVGGLGARMCLGFLPSRCRLRSWRLAGGVCGRGDGRRAMICDRCCRHTLASSTRSMFNSDALCPRCAAIEQRHPGYTEAAAAIAEHVAHGDRLYPGVGLPAGFREWARHDHIRRVNASARRDAPPHLPTATSTASRQSPPTAADSVSARSESHDDRDVAATLRRLLRRVQSTVRPSHDHLRH
jgi:hypothetical protein